MTTPPTEAAETSLQDAGDADLDRNVRSLRPECRAIVGLQDKRATGTDGIGVENSFLRLASDRARPAALCVDKANSARARWTGRSRRSDRPSRANRLNRSGRSYGTFSAGGSCGPNWSLVATGSRWTSLIAPGQRQRDEDSECTNA